MFNNQNNMTDFDEILYMGSTLEVDELILDHIRALQPLFYMQCLSTASKMARTTNNWLIRICNKQTSRQKRMHLKNMVYVICWSNYHSLMMDKETISEMLDFSSELTQVITGEYYTTQSI
jgi:hypothetical protein